FGIGDRADHALPLAVVTEAARLQDRRQTNRCDRRVEFLARIDGAEFRRRDAERLEERLLGDPILGHLERPRRRINRDAFGEPSRRFHRHVLELVRDDVGSLHEAVKGLEVVEFAANVRANVGGARLGRGIENGGADAQRVAGERDHSPELSAAENAETHGSFVWMWLVGIQWRHLPLAIRSHPMKRIAAVILGLMICFGEARAERPPQARDKAKLVVAATVKKITSKESSFGGDGTRTDYTAEVVVDSV